MNEAATPPDFFHVPHEDQVVEGVTEVIPSPRARDDPGTRDPNLPSQIWSEPVVTPPQGRLQEPRALWKKTRQLLHSPLISTLHRAEGMTFYGHEVSKTLTKANHVIEPLEPPLETT